MTTKLIKYAHYLHMKTWGAKDTWFNSKYTLMSKAYIKAHLIYEFPAQWLNSYDCLEMKSVYLMWLQWNLCTRYT